MSGSHGPLMPKGNFSDPADAEDCLCVELGLVADCTCESDPEADCPSKHECTGHCTDDEFAYDPY